jgi:hypothetical protein
MPIDKQLSLRKEMYEVTEQNKQLRKWLEKN